MNKTLELMCKMIDLQKQILAELEHATDTDKNELISECIASKKKSCIFVDTNHLEEVEKYYFMLDKINRNTYSVLDMSKKQKDKLYTYSTNIRKNIHKETQIKITITIKKYEIID